MNKSEANGPDGANGQFALLLDVPVLHARKLIASKQPRAYTDKPADLQEADADYLGRVRELYLELAAADSTWRRIAGVVDGRVRSIDEVAADVEHAVGDLPSAAPALE